MNMPTKQVSVFVENKAGMAAYITDLLARNNIDIRAINISETPDYGIFRLITDDCEKTVSVFKEDGVTASVTEVLSVILEDKVGFLAGILNGLHDSGINVEYFYAGVGQERSRLCIKVDKRVEAERVLMEIGARVE